MKGMKFTMFKTGFGFAALLFSLFSSTASTAQTAYHLGLSAGFQQTTLSSDYGTFNWQTGYYVGLANEFRFGYNSSFEVDLNYSMQGAQRAFTQTMTGFLDGHTEKYKHNRKEDLTYVNGQFLYRYNIGLGYERIIPYDQPGKRVFLTLMAGPQIGYLMGYKSTGYTDSTFLPGTTDTAEAALYTKEHPTVRNKADLDNAYYKSKGNNALIKTDIGLVGGVGMMFLIGDKGTFEFNIKYVYGFGTIDGIAYSKRVLNVNNSDITKSSIQYKQTQINNQTISVGVSYKVRLIGSGPNRNF